MSNMHYRTLCSRHPVRHSPALSGLRRALLAWRTSLGPVFGLLLLIRLPLRTFLILRMHGVRKATSAGIHRASCVQRADGAAEQGAAKVAVVRTKVLLDKIGVIRKPCLQSSKQPCWFSKDHSTLGAAGD